MAMDFKPVGWRVLVEMQERDGSTVLGADGGSPFKKCVVVDVGQPRIASNGMEVPIPVKIGDEVMFDTDNPSMVEFLYPPLFGRTLACVKCEVIYGIVSGEPDAGFKPPIRTTVEAEKTILTPKPKKIVELVH